MLDVQQLSASYGRHRALDEVSLTVDKGEIVVILGANGAGKSTLLRAISGICEGDVSGHISINQQTIQGMSSNHIVEAGIALVPEGRGVFGDLTVRENLILGAYANRARDEEEANLQRVFSLFSKLSQRQGQTVRTMSGGEQQMVAIGRAMMSNPQILMLDEPSLGLSPLLCKELFQSLVSVRSAGVGILLVEQNARQSLAIADRGYLLENARIVHADSAENLARDPAVQKAYLGAAASTIDKAVAEPTGTPNTLPATVQPPSGTPPRRTAEQLLGHTVDSMVQKAATQSSEQQKGAYALMLKDDHDARLQRMLTLIETSAASARERRVKTSVQSKPAPSTRTTNKTSSEKPVVIEVYKAPRVEVYRRREGSTTFERN